MKTVTLIACLFTLLTSITAQESQIHYLSGTGADNTKSWDFYCSAGNNSGKWAKIQVPSCWEQQGFGEYNYGHVPIEKRLKEEGRYKYEFIASKEWKDKDVQLFFEGVMTDCAIFLNGKLIGNHQGAFYEFQFDISKNLLFNKKNLLEVTVKKFSENMSVNEAERKADYWVFGGIFRPVYLQINPKEYIEHVAIDARADGSFLSDISISHPQNAAMVEVSITDFNGNQLASFSKPLQNKQAFARINNKIQQPKLWSPEFPNRYIASFRLLDDRGNIIHETSQKIGFRTVEVRAQDGIYVNNVKIKFKGVCAHTFHPDYGRTSSEKFSIETVNLIKDMNMNAVRSSHYPHDRHFLNACDSLGLFVLDELAGWQSPSYDSVIGRKLLREMIKRDVNYPSVVFWDNGNEGGWNTSYDKEFTELDIQQREVLHPWEAFGKTVTSHYITYDYLSFDHFADRKILFPTELLHGLYDGGLGAGLDDYWQKMWNHPLSAGGFLWVLADECVKRTDNGLLDGDGNHAPDGIVGPYHQKEGSFYTIKEIWSPIQIEDKYITPLFNGELAVENRFHYTHLAQCKMTYRWVKLPSSSTGTRSILATGELRFKDLAPLEKGILHVDMVNNWQTADVLEIEATDPHGRQIYTWTFPVKSPETVAGEMLLTKPANQEIQFAETPDQFVFTGKNLKIAINRSTGTLVTVQNNTGEIPLQDGPVLASNPYQVDRVTHEEINGNHLVTTWFENNKMKTVWTIDRSGLVLLDISYEPKSQLLFAGVDFSLPEAAIASVKWMGNGPYRVWKNRMKGVEFNVWEKDYNNTITGYSGFIYPEFKGYHSNFYWAQFNLKNNQSFKVYSKTEDLFLKLYNPQEGPNPQNTAVIHSKGDISFLNGIPPIGTKFNAAEKLGPQSSAYSFLSRRVPNRMLNIRLVFDFNPD